MSAQADAPPRGARSALLASRNHVVLLAFAALFVALSIGSDAFLKWHNITNVLDQASITGIVACAATLVIVAGGFDLSVGAIFAMAGIVAAKTAGSLGVPPALALGVVIGLAFGMANGVLVTAGRINSFIATLASSIMIGGVALALTGGFLVSVRDPSFRAIGTETFLSLNLSVWAFFLTVVVTTLLLTRTTFGRCVYAVGGNAEVARLSGINVGFVRTATFALSGLAAALAGVIAASRVGEAQADAGGMLALDAIAAVAIGGTSILGGEGAIWRTVVGVLLLALIGNGLTLLGIDPLYKDILNGAIIVAAVGADALARKRG